MGNKLRRAVLGMGLAASIASSGCTHTDVHRCPVTLDAAGNWKGVMPGSAIAFRREKNGFVVERTALYERRYCDAEAHELRTHLDSLGYLNLENPKVVSMLENNVYMLLEPVSESSPRGIYQRNGEYAIFNGVESLNNTLIVDAIAIKKGIRDPGKTLVHELLHDAWRTILAEESKRSFLKIASRLTNVGGSDKRTDDFFVALGDQSMIHPVALDFAEKNPVRIPGIGRIEQDTMVWLFERYCHLRGVFAGQLGNEPSRDEFFEREAYPMLMPYSKGILDEFYAPILSKKGMEELRYGQDKRFASWNVFEKLMPVLEEFVQYLRRNFR